MVEIRKESCTMAKDRRVKISVVLGIDFIDFIFSGSGRCSSSSIMKPRHCTCCI